MPYVNDHHVVGSEKNTITTYDWLKVLKGLFVIGGGGSLVTVLLTWLLENLSAGKIDLGPYSAILIPIASSIINAILKYVQDTRVVPVSPDTAL